MQNETTPAMPELGALFFAVCETAIANTAWKRVDFDKVKFVEGQLKALAVFVTSQAKKPAAPVEEEGVDLAAALADEPKSEPEPEPQQPATAPATAPAAPETEKTIEDTAAALSDEPAALQSQEPEKKNS